MTPSACEEGKEDGKEAEGEERRGRCCERERTREVCYKNVCSPEKGT